MFKCTCGNEKNFIVVLGNTHKKLLCDDCGKYIKFINETQLNLLKYSDKFKTTIKKEV